MQTILGSGGPIGTGLAGVLREYTPDIRLVSRKPVKVNDSDSLFSADLMDTDLVMEAVNGSSVAYLTAGIEYKASVWETTWPVIMRNVIDACVKQQCRLVFFDNVYMIGAEYIGHITEDSPFSPCSRKGQVRAKLDRMIMEAGEQGKLQYIIARSADFYGTSDKNNVLVQTVFDRMADGKKPQWLCNKNLRHSFTWVSDAARGTAILGNSNDAYNRVWNLPTSEIAPTGQEWIDLFARESGIITPQVQVVPIWMMKAFSVFVPIMGELSEMAYQYNREYYFDSSAFCREFGYKPVSPADGVRQIVSKLKK